MTQAIIAWALAGAVLSTPTFAQDVTPPGAHAESGSGEIRFAGEGLDVASAPPGAESGVRVSVSRFRATKALAGREASAGHAFVELDVAFENDIPLSVAFGGEREAGDRILVVLRQRLFLLAQSGNEDALAAFAPRFDLAGEVYFPEKFELPYLGASARGRVVFEVPLAMLANEQAGLALELVPEEFEPAHVTVRGTLDESLDPGATDFDSVAENEYVRWAAPVMRRLETVAGQQPPPGAQWIVVDLAGRATGGDPAPYLEAASHLQLVADNHWASTPAFDLGSLPNSPVFLASRTTGGSAVFLAPAEVASLELHAHFPLLRNFPADGQETRPETLRFPLLGSPQAAPQESALTTVSDHPVALDVIRAEVVGATYAGFTANAESSLVVLELRLRNEGDEAGLFDVPSRFGGDRVDALSVLGRGEFVLDSRQLLPARSRRAVRVLLSVARGSVRERALAIEYSGVAVHKALTIGLAEVVSQPSPVPESAELPNTYDWGRPGGRLAIDAMEGDVPELGDVEAFAENDALRLEVKSAALTSVLGDREAGEGLQFLVCAVRIARIGPGDENTPKVRWPDLQASLHLVINGRRIVPRTSVAENALPLRMAPGAEPLEGRLAYEIPAGSLRSAALHLVDPSNGNLVLLFAGAKPDEAPLNGLRTNGAIEAGVFGWSVTANGPRSRDVTVAVDLRACSLRRAIGADHGGRTEPIDHIPQGWREGRIHLLVDGTVAVPLHDADVAKPMRWLPGGEDGGPMVGGVLRFRVPDHLLHEAARVELVVGMGAVPIEEGPLLAPEAMRFSLKGEGADPPGLPEPLWSIDDDAVSVSALERVAPGQDLPDVIGIRMSVENKRDAPIWFDPLASFYCADREGNWAPVRKKALASMPFPISRSKRLWIPRGGMRVFDLPFQFDASALPGPPVLRYAGLLRHEDIALERGATARVRDMPVVGGVDLYDRDRELGGIASVGLDAARVNRAIERGRASLWSELQADVAKGYSVGGLDDHYPILLALVHSDLHEDDPAFDHALRSFLATARPAEMSGKSTYKIGILAMIAAGYGDPSSQTLLEDAARYLVEDQGPNGTWGYGSNTPTRVFALEALKDPVETETEGAEAAPLVVTGGPIRRSTEDVLAQDGSRSAFAPVRRMVDFSVNGDGDNSVTQYAALGLEACARFGVEVEPAVWRRLLAAMWDRRHATGSWGYTSGTPYGSMACAGTSIAAIALRALAPARDPLEDPRMREALFWLAEHHVIGRNPNASSGEKAHLYYHTYGIERVGRLLDTEFFGPHEWYPGMAKWLVDEQSKDGAWPGGAAESSRLASSFAMLFLTRATESLDPAVRAAERAARDAARPVTGRLEMHVRTSKGRGIVFVLDASGSMLAPPGSREKGARPKFELARDALRSALEELPEGAPVGLVVYGHRKRARDEGADEDVEVVIPVGAFDPVRFSETLDALDARGLTPLARSLDEARGSLRASGTDDGIIVLLTDGGQRREPGDPLESAVAVSKAGLTLEIIGFDVDESRSRNQAAWTKQLRDMAQAAEGRYRSIVEAGELGAAVAAAATGRPGRFEVLDDAGKVVAEGPFGGAIELPAGHYTFRTTFAGTPVTKEIDVGRGLTTRVEFDASALR